MLMDASFLVSRNVPRPDGISGELHFVLHLVITLAGRPISLRSTPSRYERTAKFPSFAMCMVCKPIRAQSCCYLSSPVRPREVPLFKVGKQARLRVNLEQASAFRPGSRKVHFFLTRFLIAFSMPCLGYFHKLPKPLYLSQASIF